MPFKNKNISVNIIMCHSALINPLTGLINWIFSLCYSGFIYSHFPFYTCMFIGFITKKLKVMMHKNDKYHNGI